jgi:hypothetical protein
MELLALVGAAGVGAGLDAVGAGGGLDAVGAGGVPPVISDSIDAVIWGPMPKSWEISSFPESLFQLSQVAQLSPSQPISIPSPLVHKLQLQLLSDISREHDLSQGSVLIPMSADVSMVMLRHMDIPIIVVLEVPSTTVVQVLYVASGDARTNEKVF